MKSQAKATLSEEIRTGCPPHARPKRGRSLLPLTASAEEPCQERKVQVTDAGPHSVKGHWEA